MGHFSTCLEGKNPGRSKRPVWAVSLSLHFCEKCHLGACEQVQTKPRRAVSFVSGSTVC